jgi:nucleoside-diphosphate-sugar epimerase
LKILVTGSRGFTGQHFIKQAMQEGHEVIPLTCRLHQEDKLDEEIKKANANWIVHLAGISAIHHKNSDEFYLNHVIGTDNLLKSIARQPRIAEKILLASSAHVYGNNPHSPLTELDHPQPISHYALSKLAMESLTSFYPDLPIIITRPFNYTGVGHDNRFIVPKIIEHYLKDKKTIELGNLETMREINDVRMVIDIYLKLLVKGQKGEIYNVCTGQVISVQTILQTIEEITGKKLTIRINPDFIRKNDILKLSGDNKKLVETIRYYKKFLLKDTLTWMIKN